MISNRSYCWGIFLLVIVGGMSSYGGALAQKVTIEKVYKYRKNQVVDLSGSTVAGKIRTPEIFYIFQMKRSKGQDFITNPKDLQHHQSLSMRRLKGAILP